MNRWLFEQPDESDIEILPQLEGLRVAFVGKLGGHTKRDAQQIVRRHAGIPVELQDEAIDLVVVGADELPILSDNDLPEELMRAAAEGRLEIISETELWQRLGMLELESNIRRLYTPMMLSQLLGVKVAAIRRWHRLGLIIAAREVNRLPYFDFQEIAVARQLARLVGAGISVGQIQQKLRRLAHVFPSAERPLAQLSVLVEGKEILFRRDNGLVEPGGQRRFDFDLFEENDDLVAKKQTIEFAPRSPKYAADLHSFEDWINLAIESEDNSELDAALHAYRNALLQFGPNPEICFRMGELLSLLNEPAAARERYFMAIELDTSYVEARANLGCVLVELGRFEEAIGMFKKTLDFHEDYPDVHFHLARLSDDLGNTVEALKYWKRFLELAPESPWADEARIRLSCDRPE
ncbi:MAG TPA: MerR family transcriptional regulator [Pirellulaceae bacterium]|nr:MerR family transcriptional regulator [Pirellulaceae bacterium]HMO94018.1 MerR family transcriptional regulator [Pirellulaceae bacterium]HMP70779.1 MerR family transcriptional regulator [Pirellulaceae bacterium]